MITAAIGILAALFVVLLNCVIYVSVRDRAVKKFIIPDTVKAGFVLDRVEFVGLLSTGDFKTGGFQIRPIMVHGTPINYTYIYIFLHSPKEDYSVRITARIKTLFFWIRKVEYSRPLNDLKNTAV